VGDAHAVISAYHRRRVENDDHKIVWLTAAAKERQNAAIAVIAVDPLEAGPIEIHLMESRFLGEKAVQVGNQMLNATMRFVLEQMPIEAAGFVPFGALPELLTHEQEFFARVRVLIREKET